MQDIGYAISWLHSVTSLLILGTLLIALLLAGRLTNLAATSQYLFKATSAMVVISLISGLFLPSLQAISMANDASAAFNIESIKLILFSTRFGMVWATQEALAVLLFLSLIFRIELLTKLSFKSFLLWAIFLSASALVIGAFKGHAAGLEPAWPGLLGHGIHVLAAGSWLGALPALCFLLHQSTKPNATLAPKQAAQLLTGFSPLAGMMAGAILLSGVLIGYLQISDWSQLFSTPYGLYLLLKVGLFICMLSIAGVIRQRLLPTYSTNMPIKQANLSISKWVLLEVSVGFVLLAFANVLKNTTPASHETEIVWPFDFRLSLDATWSESASVQTQVFFGIMLICLAIGLAVYLFRFKQRVKLAFITGISLGLAGIATVIQPLAVEAYPDTYRNSSVPYDAITIRNGGDIFKQLCVSCHGVEGEGDGVLADTLDVMLMDLNNMHSDDSTAGDMYWSFTQELFKDAYHSAIDPLDEDETWELINYLNATAASHAGLSLYTYIEPNSPFLGAPDFYYANNETSGNLKDFREDKAVLLVLFSWPQDKARLDELKRHHEGITANNAEIIAVEIAAPNNDIKGVRPSYPFIIVSEQTEAIVNSYSLFRRSFINKRDFDFTRPPSHIEFIIDRFGYLRARWIPESSTSTWSDVSLLNTQLKKLAAEPEILPPPEGHAH